MEGSLMSSTELHDGEESLGCLNVQDKPDLPIVGILPTSSAPYSLPQNCLGIVLVDASSRNLQLTVGSELTNSSYSDTSLEELQGRRLVPSTIAIPGIFHQVPNSDIDDGQEGRVYVDGHVNDVCDDSLDGANIVQQDVLTSATVQEGEKKHDAPVKKKGGWPKGKKRKEVPEIIAPKAPPTGYVMFAMQRRTEIKQSHPGIPFHEVTKLLGQEWTDMDPEKKHKFLDVADEAKKKYYEELKVFRESDAYKNVIKKKRQRNMDGISTNHGISVQDSDDPNACIEDEMNNLYCEVCDQCFTSAHNKKEHMFGKQHLQNISGEIHKQEQKAKQLNVSTEDSDSEHLDKPLDIQGFINSFRAQNHDREQEISRLKHIVKSAQEENTSLYKQVEELKLYQNRLTDEVEASKQYCQNIISQTETLKMISSMFGAMFGVINFEV